MKHEFDIIAYRQAGEEFNDKLIYVNKCIWKAEQKTIRNVINELKFMRLEIMEKCSMDQVLWPQNIRTGRKGLHINDIQILNYIGEKKWYFTELDSIGDKVIDKPTDKILPSLPDCFNEREYFNQLLKMPQVAENFTILENGSYKWTKNKNLLAGLAITLLNKGRLIADIKTNQDLARVFCPFFDVEFDETGEKSFQPNRAITEPFNFIR